MTCSNDPYVIVSVSDKRPCVDYKHSCNETPEPVVDLPRYVIVTVDRQLVSTVSTRSRVIVKEIFSNFPSKCGKNKMAAIVICPPSIKVHAREETLKFLVALY